MSKFIVVKHIIKECRCIASEIVAEFNTEREALILCSELNIKSSIGTKGNIFRDVKFDILIKEVA